MAPHETGIYEIRNIVNGKRYVGSAVRLPNRQRQHFQSLARGDHHSIALQRAYTTYGPETFEFKPLLLCAKENLLMYEQILLDGLKPEYNIAPRAGSQLGYRHSAASRARMSQSRPKDFSPMKGKNHTPETKAKISANRKGKGGGERTPERRANISAALKGRVITQEHRSLISATLTGHKQGAEQIEKRVAKLRGRKMPAGFSLAASLRMKGTILPPSHRAAIAKSKAKLSEDQVRTIRGQLALGHKQKEIASLFGVDQSVISEIKSGKSYQWVS